MDAECHKMFAISHCRIVYSSIIIQNTFIIFSFSSETAGREILRPLIINNVNATCPSQKAERQRPSMIQNQNQVLFRPASIFQ